VLSSSLLEVEYYFGSPIRLFMVEKTMVAEKQISGLK
jgi:hypothetical protein